MSVEQGGGKMWGQLFLLLLNNIGKIVGVIVGVLVSWLFLKYGVKVGLVVLICAGIGLYLGHRYDTRGGFTDVIDRFLR